MVEGVGERTGGVPLFVEEVTRLLLERGEQGGAQAIPPTLQQSLAARLDRLGEAREVAQIGAVLGREFSYRAAPATCRRAAGSTSRAASRARSARRGRPSVRRGRSAAGDLPLQARADPGRGLRQPAQEPPPGAAPPRGRRAARAAERRARSDRPSFHRRPASTTPRSNGGARPATRRSAARPSRRRSPISARRSPWRTRRRARNRVATQARTEVADHLGQRWDGRAGLGAPRKLRRRPRTRRNVPTVVETPLRD